MGGGGGVLGLIYYLLFFILSKIVGILCREYKFTTVDEIVSIECSFLMLHLYAGYILSFSFSK